MTPYMPQGASTSIEDAALQRYQTARLERAAAIQRKPAQNTWLKNNTNAEWVYGYDAWTTPLA